VNMRENMLDASRASVYTGNLFEPLGNERFDVIATNPPYIPAKRVLPESVDSYEPSEALFSGEDGLTCIREILQATPQHLKKEGALWLECDVSHADAVLELAKEYGATACAINEDQYGRPRLLVSYYE